MKFIIFLIFALMLQRAYCDDFCVNGIQVVTISGTGQSGKLYPAFLTYVEPANQNDCLPGNAVPIPLYSEASVPNPLGLWQDPVDGLPCSGLLFDDAGQPWNYYCTLIDTKTGTIFHLPSKQWGVAILNYLCQTN